MPLTHVQPTRVTLHYRDYSGGSASHWTQVPQGLDKAEIEPFALDLCQCAERLTDAEIVGATILRTLKAEYGMSGPSDSSDVARCGTFIFESVATDDRFVFVVPSLLPGKLSSSGQWAGIAIDLNDIDVAALVDLIILGSGGLNAISYALNDLIKVNVAYLQWRST